MTHPVLAEMMASITELKRDPMRTVASGEGGAIAILNRNEPIFYCVPADMYEVMLEKIEDAELNALADSRSGEAVVRVTLDEL
jgi:antitoxin StbD